MKTRTAFPSAIRLIEHAEIPLSDGVKLSAMIWLPKDAEDKPVPAVLEYLPYRKRDGTTERDALNHPYFAGHGYAAIRVDMRGAGDSEGVLKGEYLKQEQDDALEVLRWIAEQPWSTGAVGMIGISWGGFNGLQIAARRPPELKAVISLCSTDDRYADDIHFMGGCLLVDKFAWGSTMFSINATPPDPELVGDKWRALWLGRLNESGFWLEEWHRRQRRDDFYKHGSICEDYGAIQCPVYLVGGWMDGYTNAIFRMMEHLQCPKKALIGPWAHKYPNFAEPGPGIGFLQESLRWWDKWLKGIETGIMAEPTVRAWIQEPVPPQRHYKERPGRWVAEESWPIKDVQPLRLALGAQVLSEIPDNSERFLSICSPQTIGLAAGKWCPYGLEADGPGDQREEAGGSLIFDSAPFEESLDLLGAPVLHLDVAADRPNAFVAATLSEVLPDGAVTRLTYGLLNLTHRDGHVDVTPVEPGRRYRVTIRMNEFGQRVDAGNRLRLALASAYWPIVWPSPEPVTLTIATGASHLDLPVRRERPEDLALKPFESAENAPALRKTSLRQSLSVSTITRDLNAGTVEVYRLQDDGLTQVDAFNWTYGVRAERRYRIDPDDPLSATAETNWRKEYARDGFHIAVETQTAMSVTRTELVLTGRLIAREGDEVPFSREWSCRIPRDHL
jgi:uncharacterized protein